MRTWLITGVSGGFGRLMAEQLLAGGDRVAGTVRDLEAVADLADAYPDRFWVRHLDLTDPAGITDVVEAAFAELGRIDVIVNNAGYGLFGAVEELSGEQIDHQIATNLVGPILVTRTAIPHLRAQGGGRIIALSTYGGQAVNPGASLYHASKWGLEGFMESTALDVAPFGIGVTIVEPGSAATAFRTGGARLAAPLAVYGGTPAAMVRGIRDPRLPSIGDPARMAAAIIDSVEREPAPRRLVLGSDAFRYVRDALRERLADVETQERHAGTTDARP